MKIAGQYRRLLATIGPTETLAQAAKRMTSWEIGVLAVWDGELEGIISERDVTRAVAEGADTTRAMVVDFMTTRPYVVHPQDDSSEATALMLEVGIRHLPVVENNEVVGMLSIRDLLAIEAEVPAIESEGSR